MVNPDEEAIVRCETTAGTFTMKLTREWSPNGYDRAVELFERHFYDGSHFYRVVPKFLVQFGISYSKDQALQRLAKTPIPDDPTRGFKFQKGTISYAGSGDNSRTSQLFISYGAASSLGKQKWETPVGSVIEGMDTVEKFYSYGDMPPWGEGPKQGQIHGHPEYIEDNFPKTDKFVHCKVERWHNDKPVGDESISIIHKHDKVTDEEEFQKAREQLEQKEREIQQERLQQGHQQQPQKLNSPYKQQVAEIAGDNLVAYGGFALVGIVLFIFMALKTRKKVTSKSS